MSGRKVVAHFVRGFPDPTEIFIENQLRSLSRYERVVYCRRTLPGHSFEDIGVNDVPGLLSPAMRAVETLSYSALRWLSPVAGRRLSEHVRRSGASVLHLHFIVDARFFIRVCRDLRLPAVVSAYGYDVSYFPRVSWGIGLKYLRPMFDAADIFLAMSEDMRRDIIGLGCPAEKVLVHYHGICVDRFLYPARTYAHRPVTRILVCGRLIPKKGHAVLFRALAGILRERLVNDPFSLVVVGEGPLRPHLESLAKDLGLQDVVIFRGYIPYHHDAFLREYGEADIFALPSLTVHGDKEGIPSTLVEAMTSGLAVVSTYHAGIPEVVTSGRDGILVREGDSEALASELARLIKTPRLREELGSAAARKARDSFDARTRGVALETIYDDLIRRKARPQ
jgi:colanic acid/amylovoran biosynthesis glycosyltransferase